MDNVVLTANMTAWLKELYLNAATESRKNASNYHLFALGSENERAANFEALADEYREFAHILECLAKELELEE